MKGDFSRVTFDPHRAFSGVLMQQGRVQLDADWNEQSAIVQAAVRALARDLLGSHCGSEEGFKLTPVAADLSVGVGWYYVDGIRCENRASITLTGQAGFPFGPDDDLARTGTAIAYLDVWERLVTAIEDPSIREVALGGPDTATRSQVVWRIRLRWDDVKEGRRAEIRGDDVLSRGVSFTGRASMRARALSQDAARGYKGRENQLYRVEIHEGGVGGTASFKWSRDNGSVAAAVLEVRDGSIRIDPSLLRQGRELRPGDWVEPADDLSVLRDAVPPLLRIQSVEGDLLRVSSSEGLSADPTMHPLVRRWDQGDAGTADRGGAIPVVEQRWLDLEEGVQVSFEERGSYRGGDYWLIPARTVTGDVEWPSDERGPLAQPLVGVRHHRAPLARIQVGTNGRVRVLRDLRRTWAGRG
jgi:Family of unknown function (DUF6519)